MKAGLQLLCAALAACALSASAAEAGAPEEPSFVPVPIIITEPAIGAGGGAALLHFRPQKGRTREGTPADVYGVAVGGTSNGTKFGAVGAALSFAEDRWRYRGGVGLADVNLDFYGTGGPLITGDRSVGYNLAGIVSSQQALRRLGDSDNFVGAHWMYLDIDAAFDLSPVHASLPPLSRGMVNSGLGLSLEHDSRDNVYTASRGWSSKIETTFYSPEFGGDNRYEIYRARALRYAPVAKALILGLRADARAGRGDVPFYQLPYVEIRGVPALRYQDDNAGVLEAELRWNVSERWALVGFAGAGRAWGSRTSFQDAGTVTSRGAGVRYLVLRQLGLYVGVDIARGPEDTAFYIQTGSAWK